MDPTTAQNAEKNFYRSALMSKTSKSMPFASAD